MKIEEKRVKSILHSYIIYNLDETVRIDPDLVKAQILQLFEDEKRELFRLIEDEEPNAFARLYPKLSRYLKGEQ